MLERKEANEVRTLERQFVKMDIQAVTYGGGQGKDLSCNDLDLLFLPIVKNCRYSDGRAIVSKSLIHYDICNRNLKNVSRERREVLELFERWTSECSFVELDLEHDNTYVYSLKLSDTGRGFVKLYPVEFKKIMSLNYALIRRVNCLRVLLKLRNLSTIGGNGYCYPSHIGLADSTGLSEDTINNRLKDLEQIGLIKTGNACMYNKNMKQHSGNIYVCTTDFEDALSKGIEMSKKHYLSLGYSPDIKAGNLEVLDVKCEMVADVKLERKEMNEKKIDIVVDNLILMNTYNRELPTCESDLVAVKDSEIFSIRSKVEKTLKDIALIEMDDLFKNVIKIG